MENATEIKACNVRVPAEGMRRIAELQDEFASRTNGGKMTQTKLAELGLKKLSIEDLLPSDTSARVS
jgi:hypothetical protein